MPSGPRTHLWPVKAYMSAPVRATSTGIWPTDWAPSTRVSTSRSRARMQISSRGNTSPLVQSTCERATRRVRGLTPASTLSAVTGGGIRVTLTPKRLCRLCSGARHPGCSVVAETTSSPSRQPIEATPRFIPWVVFWVRATLSGSVFTRRAAPSRGRAAAACVQVDKIVPGEGREHLAGEACLAGDGRLLPGGENLFLYNIRFMQNGSLARFSRRRRRLRSRRGRFVVLLRNALLMLCFAVVLGVVVLFASFTRTYTALAEDMPELDDYASTELAQTSVVYDANGNVVDELYGVQNRFM